VEYAAIDLGRPYSVVCLMEDGHKACHRFRLSRTGLDRWFKDRATSRVLVESSTESEWVAKHLEALGHEVVVADPNYSLMYGERTRHVKTDNRDADALFEANRAGVYRPAHRRSLAGRRMVQLLGMRESLVRTRTRWINVMRASLRREGHWVPSGSAESFCHRLEDLCLPAEVTSPLSPMVSMWDSLNEQVMLLEGQIEKLGEHDSRVRLLQTAPTIGPMRAAGFVAVIDEPHRFRNAHQVESYLGLVPSEWSSSEKQCKGRITKAGDTRVRWLLVEAAWMILRSRRPECAALKEWANGIAARRGQKVAVVALARRMAGILWAMLRDQEPFNPARLGHVRRAA
jgi:transposase